MYGTAPWLGELRGSMGGATMSTVLIVEDEFAILFVAESTLRIEGYETVAAATRKDALAILRSDQKGRCAIHRH